MPRPRFEKLEPARRAAILAVGAEEFAEHGYEAASFNRIIERSGLSKGAFYYYFDDKEDLYATVLRDALQRLVIDSGDNMTAAFDAESFWREYEVWYVRSLRLFQEDPHAVGLARSLVKALSRGTATGVLAELRQSGRAWLDAFIAHGQSLGAIRRDLPGGLLATVLLAMDEGIDLWLGERIGAMSDPQIAATAAMLTRLYRSVAEPPAAAARAKAAPKKKRSGR